MQITRTEEHGIRLIMRLAAEQKQMTVVELATMENMPEPTVAKVLLLLRRGGLVTSERGRRGGYRLARGADEISVGMVLQALGDPLFEGRFCGGLLVPPSQGCPRSQGCGLRSVWRHIEAMIMQVLSGTTLADLLHSETSVTSHVAQLWAEARTMDAEKETITAGAGRPVQPNEGAPHR
ncbi:MAG: Rrf2 family transcriptional regulator [Acidobacteria bacterium]|nr:Rrf2 family transcriptional regulator [Acidobacteriota bacterium]